MMTPNTDLLRAVSAYDASGRPRPEHKYPHVLTPNPRRVALLDSNSIARRVWQSLIALRPSWPSPRIARNQ